jgi:hypothetical protein
MGTTPLWVPLVVAVIGLVATIVGTIVGVIITQRRSDRREKIAWERERERERERWAREDAARTFELRRERLDPGNDLNSQPPSEVSVSLAGGSAWEGPSGSRLVGGGPAVSGGIATKVRAVTQDPKRDLAVSDRRRCPVAPAGPVLGRLGAVQPAGQVSRSAASGRASPPSTTSVLAGHIFARRAF